MTVCLKFPAKLKKTVDGSITLLEKGTRGSVIGVSNSERIIKEFPNIEHKVDGWYYIVRFPEMEDCLFMRDQLKFDLTDEIKPASTATPHSSYD